MKRILFSVVSLTVAFLGPLALPAWGQELEDLPEIEWYQASQRHPRGEEIVMVYFGGASCGPCQNPTLKQAHRHAQLLLSTRAQESGLAFASIGVAIDWRTDVGVQWLATVAHFDEISAGRSWSNSVASEWLIEHPEVAATRPSIVVYRRRADYKAAQSEYSEKELLKALQGGDEIIAWVKAGAPIG